MESRTLEAAITTLRYAVVRKFYAELLGLPVASEGRRHVFFQVGGDKTVPPSGHGIYLDLAVTDLFSVRRKLLRSGIKLIDDHRDEHGVAISLQDPEGNLLNLFQEGSFSE